MAQHGDFMTAASVLAPHQMGTRVRYEEKPDGTLERFEDKPAVPLAARWSDFGLCRCECSEHQAAVLMFHDNTCGHWSGRSLVR